MIRERFLDDGFCVLQTKLQAILIGLGLQHKTADELAAELELPTTQLLGLFNRTARKLSQYLTSVVERDLASQLNPSAAAAGPKPAQLGASIDQPLANELEEEAKV